jgi:hypothetical protein
MYIKPKPGLVIPDPERRDLLPPEGREVQASAADPGVPASGHWHRRLLDGDIEITEAPAEPAHEGA